MAPASSALAVAASQPLQASRDTPDTRPISPSQASRVPWVISTPHLTDSAAEWQGLPAKGKLACQVIAAAAGSSAVMGFIQGIEERGLVDTGAGYCKPPAVGPPAVIAAFDEGEPAEVVVPGDSVLNLTCAEWGRLQMEDVSLMALRCRTELGHKESAPTDSPRSVLQDGLLMWWDEELHRHRIVVPTAFGEN
ncbi:unnamed protein product [Lampetra planeri]